MRLISADKLAPGMILGKDLYGKQGHVLLYSGTVLQNSYINSIVKLQFSSIYIEDEISKDVVIRDVIAEETRRQSVESIKNMFVGFNDDKKVSASFQSLSSLVDKVVDDVIKNRSSIVNLIDIKNHDDYTYQHSVNVAVLATVIGVAMNFPRKKLYDLSMAALFHDLGKVKIPLSVLNKKGRLSKEEFEEMKMHPIYGFEIAKQKLEMSAFSYIGILHHHEKFDGSGYPAGKAGEDITLFGRIIAVSDVYDAITSSRPYHEPVLPSEAFEFIMANSCVHFDPEVVTIFTKKVAAYPLGTTVFLSNGKKGIVIDNYEDASTRPKIRLLKDGDIVEIDLRNDPTAMNLTIVDIER